MRARTLLLGSALGLGAYYLLKDQGKNMEALKGRLRQGETGEPVASRSPEQDDLAHMIEDVAHRDDIPETPVKQAFEEAVEHPEAHHLR